MRLAGQARLAGLVLACGAVGVSAQPLPDRPAPKGAPKSAAGPAALRPTIDVYPGVLAARVIANVPPLLGVPAEAKVRVRVALDTTGAVTAADLERSSGFPAFDAVVVETLASFRGAGLKGSLGVLPLPQDDLRRATVTTRGVSIDVRPPSAAKEP